MSAPLTRLAGYASVFGVPDAGGDVVERGAFARAIGSSVPLLWQHDANTPIGLVDRIAEDARGLRIIASVEDTRTGRDALALLAARALTGLSFGYRVRASRPTRGGRILTDFELIEVSLVTFPMQRLARVHAISPAARTGALSNQETSA
ncbi:HK97 family phage prohead protease [Glacieibacterium megasporae]|uniref:HK97 family phage prohead protease n=1 Tax=Glacieibacterium megasporae TaxID=2835787 RepID=UPI00210504EB|nr:HK97 family phage prohead protease [Polymorphobacter megasporae]